MASELPHKSVLVHEVLACINPKPDEVYVDVTFGSGGHTCAILKAEERCTVIGIDWDKDSINRYSLPLQKQFGKRFIPLWGNFAHIVRLLKKINILY
jgi:16S rRNA (cytosine1402-N4)-methyltransferase